MTSAAAAIASCEKFRPLLVLAMRLVDEGKATDADAAPVLATAAKACEHLAGICLEVGMLAEARQLATDRLRLNDRSVLAHQVISELDRRIGALDQAAGHLGEIIRLEPGVGRHHHQFALMALSLGRPGVAAQHFASALALDPELTEAANQLAFFFMTQGRLAEALALSESVLARDPADRQALINAGQAAIGLGRMEEARGHLAGLLARHPGDCEGHLLMSRLKTYAPDDTDLAAMQAEWQAGGQAPSSRSRLGFALFKALDDTGRHDEAFGVLAEANRIRRAGFSGFRVEDSLDFMAQSAEIFTPALIARLSGAGLRGERPVFILGLPRSGTTLCEQILSGHSQVAALGELDTLAQLVIAHGLSADRKGLADLSGDRGLAAIAAMAEAYRATTVPLAAGRPRHTDKMPINFLWIGFIAAMFPDATIIHMRRDPIANGFSLFASTFDNQAMEWAYDLADLGRFMAAHDRLMAHWHTVLPGRILEVGYEDLTADPESGTRRILDACGLGFEAACLDPAGRRRTVLTLSASQVVRPVYDGRDKRTAPYRKHLAPLLLRLGEGAG